MIARATSGGRSRARGASLVEYALLIVAVMLVAAGAMRALGVSTAKASRDAAAALDAGGGGGGGAGGALAAAQAGGGGDGGGRFGVVGDFFRGLVMGDFAEGGNGIARTAGQVTGGFIPIWGQIADLRDIAAAVGDIYHGREGGWGNFGLAMAAVLPGVGDGLKAAVRGGGAAADAARGAARVGDEAAAAARHGDEAAQGAGAAARNGDDLAAGAVGAARRSTDEIIAAANEARRWADEHWDEIQALPRADRPDLVYHGTSDTVLDSVRDRGVLSGEALGKPPGPNSSQIWFKKGAPFYDDGETLTLVAPTDRIRQMGGVDTVGLNGQPNVFTVAHGNAPNGIPFDEFAVVIPAGNGYVIPVHIPPGWSGPALPTPPGWTPP